MRALFLALTALAAGALFAQPPDAAAAHAAHFEKLATLLDLSDAQKTSVQAILEQEHAKMQAAHEQAKASGTKPDFAQMKAMHEQMQQETLQKMKTVLSEAQLKKFQVLQEMHTEMMHGHFGHGGPPGGNAPPAQN
jgi:hypothetical protein